MTQTQTPTPPSSSPGIGHDGNCYPHRHRRTYDGLFLFVGVMGSARGHGKGSARGQHGYCHHGGGSARGHGKGEVSTAAAIPRARGLFQSGDFVPSVFLCAGNLFVK
jgi:hypothetical protein